MSEDFYAVRATAFYTRNMAERGGLEKAKEIVRRKVAFYVKSALSQGLIRRDDTEKYAIEFFYEPLEGFDSVGNRKVIGKAKFPAARTIKQ